MDCRTDPVSQARSVARISTDSVRQFVFHVAVEGSIETGTGLYPKRKALQTRPGILALDMNQPMQIVRTCVPCAGFFPAACAGGIRLAGSGVDSWQRDRIRLAARAHDSAISPI